MTLRRGGPDVVGEIRESPGFFREPDEIRFGQCLVDSETRELHVRGKAVHLTPKAFQLLEILLENRPRALAKPAIHERLWPGTFASDGTLTSLLAEASGRGHRGRRAADPSSSVLRPRSFGYASLGEEASRDSEVASCPREPFSSWIWADRARSRSTRGANILGEIATPSPGSTSTAFRRHHVAGDSATIEDLRQ